MLASNRAVEEIIKSVPDTIRKNFIAANLAKATDADIEKLFVTYENYLNEYRATLAEDSMFYAECSDNPYIQGTTPNYSYAHFLHVLKQRMEAAVTLDERELLRRQYYERLTEYKYSDSVVLEIVTDKLQMSLETPSWFASLFSGWFKKKPKAVVKTPAITHNEKPLEQAST